MGDPDRTKVRNICILAHVDHGKTTLADHLIAACGGGVLHPKLAGKQRFMDYLDEEQRRAITMKSSSIALQFDDYLINLIDSPGHMDFCSEVSTAARLSDGALVLVDAVEGVHIQTHAVLRQAWVEKLKLCLVINKMDRLFTELKLTPMEAYSRLQRIVHDVNRIISAYKSEKYLSDVDSLLAGGSGESNEEIIDDDEQDEFQPQKGNVSFACALDGWGFSITQFAKFYAERLGGGANVKALGKGLWGPRYFDKKRRMIVGKKAIESSSNSKKPQPMFVEFVLGPLWQVYESALDAKGNKGMLDKVIKNFSLTIPNRELQNKDPKSVLQSVMSRWLPLSDCILSMVVEHMHDPATAQPLRIGRLLPRRELVIEESGPSADINSEAEFVRKSVENCDSSSNAPFVAFVSKMFAIPTKMLPHRGSNGEIINSNGEIMDSGECFLAFARIFSGAIQSGQKVFVLSALYDPLKGESMQKHVQQAEIQSLYLMMGQGLTPVPSATAGNIVAIQGLGQHILKSATLSSTKNCYPFASMMFQVSPTLRVAIEPSDPMDMNALMQGLRLLNRADPFVEVSVSSRGEHVLAAAGEVHLERCIKDLKERFAKVSLQVSAPLVSFKETIDGDIVDFLDYLKGSIGNNSRIVEKVTSNGRFLVKVQVVKLPMVLTKILEESGEKLADILEGRTTTKERSTESDIVVELKKRIMNSLESELEGIEKEKVEKYRDLFHQFLKRIWCLGPGLVGPNILLSPDSKASDTIHLSNGQEGKLIRGSNSISRKLGFLENSCSDNAESLIHYPEAESLKSNIVSGFQLATSAGPLCDEPIWGLAFAIEPYLVLENTETTPQSDQSSILSGQVITVVKEACRSAVLQNRPRLVEAMYFCEINTPTQHLGSMYAVLSRRRARVLKEEMQEGSSLFTVHAYLPVAESFGFSDELTRWTSGACSALLVLSHWEVIPEDPFFVPKTEEEIEEFGDGSSVPPNIAIKLMNSVRRRKGLHVEEKVVQHATKQRTLARKV